MLRGLVLGNRKNFILLRFCSFRVLGAVRWRRILHRMVPQVAEAVVLVPGFHDQAVFLLGLLPGLVSRLAGEFQILFRYKP